MAIKIIECPRDAMQSVPFFIPTEQKITYINTLLKVGFDTIDFGSFVSPKTIPQMKDTAEVLSKLDLSSTSSKLLAIIANTKGAETACSFDEITYLGFPFSVSETFQKRNTNSTIAESLKTVAIIQELCVKHQKQLVIYLSMAFGNPYGDPWSTEIVQQWTKEMINMDIRIIALADTVGMADAATIGQLFTHLVSTFPYVTFGAHLHTAPYNWKEKVKAAYQSGCRRFDTALKGYGGCPMAKDELTGNLPTESLIAFLEEEDIPHGLDKKALQTALTMNEKIFSQNN